MQTSFAEIRGKKQGWTLQRTAYCQLICDANKVKRLEYAQRIIQSGDTFDNVIFSDECSISLVQYRRTCYRKVDEPTKRKPKPKHPLKVYVWAGISRHGPTKICIFDGIMDADLFWNILETTLVLFIRETLPNHRFMQDNEKISTGGVPPPPPPPPPPPTPPPPPPQPHTLNLSQTGRERTKYGIKREKKKIQTGASPPPPPPPESPDLNPIEDLWHELKFFLESKVKPYNKQELVDGIKKFWTKKVTLEKCAKYIDHVLHKAILAVVEAQGAATKY